MKQLLFFVLFGLITLQASAQCPPETNVDTDGDGVLDCIDPCPILPNSIIGNLSFESDFLGWTIPQNSNNFFINEDVSNTLHGTKALYVNAPNATQFENYAIYSEEFTLEEGIGYSFRIPAKRIGSNDGDALRWALVDENGLYRHLNNYYDFTTDWTTISVNNLQIDLSVFTSNKFRLRLEFGLSQTDMVVDRIEFFKTSQGYDPLYEDLDNDGNPDCTDLSPTNDSVLNATEITILNYFEPNIRLDLADVNTASPNGCNVNGFSGVYYKFTATEDALINSQIFSSSPIVSSFIIAYTADNLNATSMAELTHVPQSACVFGTQTSFPIVSGESYYVMVHRSDSNALTSFGLNAISDVPVAERNALIDLYNNTNGTNWTNNTNWNTLNPVSTWLGITVTNIGGTNHVTDINLFNNNLDGSINSTLNQLTQLKTLWLHSNNLAGEVPDLSTLNSLEDFLIDDNQFSFADLEPNFNSNINIQNFRYFVQQFIENPVVLAPIAGETISLSMNEIDGSNVNYQWYKTNRFDQNPNTGILVGEISNTLDFSPLEAEDLDTYQCWATSPLIPGLTYRSAYYNLQGPVSQQERNALITFYNALGGDNWTDNTNWLTSEPVSTWSHITTSGNKVIAIDIFGEGNWVGQIPTEIENLIYLEYFGIALNAGVTGSIPESIGNLSNLERLRLQGVPITGTLPASISNLSNLTELRVIGTDMTSELPSELGNLSNLRDMTLFGSGVFSFGQQSFSGNIPPSFGNLTNLTILNLSGNSFEGQVPSTLSNLSNLLSLRLNDNNLSGALPDFSGNTNSNLFFALENNRFNFSDLEPLINNVLDYNSITYSPQNTNDEEETIISAIGSNITLTINELDLNRSDGATSNQYQWFKDNVAITGANASSYTITNAQTSDNGVYYCEITNAILPDLTIIRANITLSIDPSLTLEDVEASEILIYPNPTKNWLNIKTHLLANAQLSIFDINGRLVFSKIINRDTNVLNVETLSSGTYILKLDNSTSSFTKRFIKQ